MADESESRIGPAAGIQLGVQRGAVGFVVDVSGRTFRVDNPRRAEAPRTLWVLPGVEVTVRDRGYVRGGVGVALSQYAGSDIVAESETGLGWALAGGLEGPAGRLRPGMELKFQSAHSSDGELVDSMATVQVTLRF